MKRIPSLGLALVATATLAAFPAQDAVSRARAGTAPIHLIGVIPLPGNPLVTSDIIWVDPGTRRLYVTDRSNFGIDIVDAENDLFVGRITGFAGPETSRGDPNANATAPPPNGEGPSGVLVTPNKKLWAGDGNSTVRVADVDPSSPNYLKIIQSISTAIPECGAHCDRADEIASRARGASPCSRMPTRVQSRSEEPGRIDLPGRLDFSLKNPTTK
jgi:hypothetical protein